MICISHAAVLTDFIPAQEKRNNNLIADPMASLFQKTLLTKATILLMVILLTQSCDTTPVEGVNSREIGNYIAAHTGGVIPAGAEVVVRFTQALPLQVDHYEAVEDELFLFDPPLKGKTYWINDHTLAFKPDGQFRQGASYQGTLLLSELFDVRGELSRFYFQFRIRVLDMKVNVGSLQPYAGQSELYRLNGELDFSDAVEPDVAAGILKAYQQGQLRPISMTGRRGNSLYEFTVDSIQRKEADGELRLEWDGNVAGIERKDSQLVRIPSTAEFDLLKVRVYQLPSQRVVLTFSDHLKKGQMLGGLISLDGDDKLQFSIRDNEIEIYPPENTYGLLKLQIEPGIKSITGAAIQKRIIREVSFSRLSPQIELSGKGTIMPPSMGMMLPFRAVGLNAADVRVIRIYESNILQFLQANKLDGNYELRRVGRPVHVQTIDLASTGKDMNAWNHFSLDLGNMIKPEPGAIYHVEFSFRRAYAAYECPGGVNDRDPQAEGNDIWEYEESSLWDDPEYYYWGYWPDDYSWYERDNPCHDSYYTSDRFTNTNILASDLGIIVKSGGGGRMLAMVTSLITSEPLGGVRVEAYNYQLQPIGAAVTNEAGMAELTVEGKPFVLVAFYGEQKGYLRVDDGSALSVSSFDVSGKTVREGLRGYIYGERGVWRPGDTLFLNFMLDDRESRLPDGHPVVFELFNPQGRMVKRLVRTASVGGIYDFATATEAAAPTGIWNAIVRVGGTSFSKQLRIETVKPNRLKIAFDPGQAPLAAGSARKALLEVRWLHGATAKNLKARVEMTIYQSNKGFENYSGYTFTDPSRSFYTEEKNIFDGRVNERGRTEFSFVPPKFSKAPGMLQAGFTIRAFEEGGDFSTDFFTMDYAPFKTFVGLRLPEGDKRNMLLTDTTHRVEVVTCDAAGRPVSVNRLNAAIYKVSWRWWWNASDNDMASYFGTDYQEPLSESVISTGTDGRGSFSFKIDYPDWGRYFVRIWDPAGGAAAGKTVYVDWPGWAGQAMREFPGAAALLSLSTDKSSYLVGETVNLTFPGSGTGRALLTIESGSDVLDARWVMPDAGPTMYSFEATPEMAPNVYVQVMLVQPHAQSENDAPMRLYGIIPVLVEDPASKIRPVLEMPGVLEPEKPVSIKVYEEKGMPFSYTIAMVDEGLLDLTRFSTPDPWKHFFAREALGVKTWDLYNYVIGAWGGRIESVFGIGGDEELAPVKDKKANRFKPVVKHLGPFSLGKGESAVHRVVMPDYVGSVRTMVVASGYMSFGAAEKTTAVKKPLMILATLPRVLGPGEKVDLPVTVFAMDEGISAVSVKVATNDMLQAERTAGSIDFDAPGEGIITFGLEAAKTTGLATVSIEAVSGSHRATYAIELDIRNPNPPVTEFINKKLAPGEEFLLARKLPGMESSNKVSMEVSAMLPVNLERRLRYLLTYPHGCLEQVVSAAFPQLYLKKITEVSQRQERQINANIRAAINRMPGFQAAGGGLRTWPGSAVSDWVTTYAGHFFLEAEKRGYTLPIGLKAKWLEYQQERAARWSPDEDADYNLGLGQAYRLYTLALSGNPDLRAMNRLRELPRISNPARWRLIAAYALAGQPEAASKLAKDAGVITESYPAFDQTYGSGLRDMAMILESLCLLNEKDKAFPLAMQVSAALTSPQWMSTQTSAFCLLSMAAYLDGLPEASDGMRFSYTVYDQAAVSKAGSEGIERIEPDVSGKSAIRLRVVNDDDKDLHLGFCLSGTPLVDSTGDMERGISMKVVYRDMSGAEIDPARLEQGMDFMAEVRVTNAGIYNNYRDLALTQVFPSGWEIMNRRMQGLPAVMDESAFEYRDVRDDRVITYFGLERNGSVKFSILLNAAYTGRYYLPGVYCEAMYDHSVFARKSGRWVEVVRAE
jgi:alpha-2-macroglobulin